MRTFLSISQDATIYQRYPEYNSGVDEILEIGKLKDSLDTVLMYASASARSLINFDISNITSYPTSSKFYLNLYIANATDVHRYQELLIYPLSSSWVEGSGYRYQDVKNVEDGVTWTHSAPNIEWVTSGSDYITTVSASYSMSMFPTPDDIKIEITDILLPFVTETNTFEWNGLLIKFPDGAEASSSNKGNIKVFSKDTHTVFYPRVEIVYEDQSFSTGSLKPIPSTNIVVQPKNLKQEYTRGEIDKIYLVTRDKYPEKPFDATQRYRNMYYLPSESYWRLRDSVSGVLIQTFDKYSAVNCDASGSYILLDTSGLDLYRYYTLELKVKTNSLVFFPSFTYEFKITSDE